LILALVVILSVVLPVMAAEPTIDCTVSTKLIAIDLDITSVAFGEQSFGDADIYSEVITLSNIGSVAVEVAVRGTDATLIPGTWGLGSSAAVDQYAMALQGVDPAQALKWLTTGTTTWLGGLGFAASGTQTMKLRLNMPLEGSIGAGQTASMSVTFVATEVP